ncbi:hypothetical protein Ciccas_011554 [Cichlidogyrus casuarinus]|uniref:Uncharacterized protein n=1 Tax=Cichlidogyrus casuarinus TaxID=1844966 RepID=A0ABD2PVQ0_9PLAT
MLQNMRDELARCLDRKVTSPKPTEERPVEIPVQRLNSSLSHVSLFSTASTTKAPPMAPKPTRFSLQARGAKSTGDLREATAKIHDFPAVVAIKEAAKSNSVSPVVPARTMKSSGSSARHIASLHDRLMEEQRKRSHSADRSHIEVVLSVAQ